MTVHLDLVFRFLTVRDEMTWLEAADVIVLMRSAIEGPRRVTRLMLGERPTFADVVRRRHAGGGRQLKTRQGVPDHGAALVTWTAAGGDSRPAGPDSAVWRDGNSHLARKMS